MKISKWSSIAGIALLSVGLLTPTVSSAYRHYDRDYHYRHHHTHYYPHHHYGHRYYDSGVGLGAHIGPVGAGVRAY